MTRISQPVWPWQGEQKTMNLIEKARDERRQTQSDEKRGNERVFVSKKAWHNLAENLCAGDPDWRAWLEKIEKPTTRKTLEATIFYEDNGPWYLAQGDNPSMGELEIDDWKSGDRVRVTIERLE